MTETPAAPAYPDGAATIAAILAQAEGAPQPPLLTGADAADPRDDAGDWMPDDPGEDHEQPMGAGGIEVDGEIVQRCIFEPQNDIGNARRLIAHFGEDLRFGRELGWHLWTGAYWDMEAGKGAVEQRAHWTASRIVLEARAMRPFDGEAGEDFDKRKAGRRKFGISSGNRARTVAMIQQAEPYLTVPVGAFDADPLLVAVRNGVLRFHREADPDCPDPDVVRWKVSCTFEPHAREHLVTKLMPVDYDPAATCPRWLEFLDRVQPKARLQRFLQVFHGLGITGRTVQALVFHYGGGANGKSVFINAICDLMGGYAQQLSSESLTGQGQRRGDQATPDLARLPGARLVRISELPRGEPLKEALVKQLTGGEPMLVRHLNRGFFEFLPEFKAVMSGNDKPRIGGVDHGIWRRMRLVPWEVTIPEHEQREMGEVLAEFAAERSGILNWLIEGAKIFLAEGMVTPEEVVDATAEYREEMDPIGSFIADCVTRTEPAENYAVTARVMYEAYVSWSLANAKRPWKETQFGTVFPGKGFEKTRERVRRYLDCRLHDVPERPDAPRSPPSPYGDLE
ncbi:MAG: hypothetical protein B7Z15_01865 [Rhizobiales bacterium 32-66-8]|nr:MAG: hypothetical protein B7Z15_01865 [Rhizobiales bacterium 32-66-8]